MLYRIKDFEAVYQVSEGKFKKQDEEMPIARSIDEVMDIAKADL